MTSRQIERAVNACLSRILPPLVQQLRDDLVADLRQHLAARDDSSATDAELPSALHQSAANVALVAAPPKPATAPAQPKGEPASGPWTLGTGSRRRLTDAGLARTAELLAQGKTDSQIAAEMGISRKAVENRRLNGTTNGSPWAAISQEERDKSRAEKTRQYQREWYRKRRAAQGATPRASALKKAAPAVPAPRQPPAPVLPPSVTVTARHVPEVLARLTPARQAEPQVITTTTKDVRAWLVASMKAGGLTQLQAMDRVGFMTHEQALAEANQRRLRGGLPPFAFLGVRSAA